MNVKYTEENLREAVAKSKSITEVCRLFGVRGGGSISNIKNHINKFGLDMSHFTGSNWNKGKPKKHPIPIDDYLSNKRKITSYQLKLRLLSNGVLDRKCSSCGGSEWLGQPIPIELDHINGNKHDNSLENLRLLCPNCHAQTPTYKIKNSQRYKNRTLKKEKAKKIKSVNVCGCGNIIDSRSKTCSFCYHKNSQKINWPPTDIIIKLVQDTNYCKVASDLGVSDNAVRKHIRAKEQSFIS